MKYLIVTQTFPPRTGGMQNVMEAISKKLANDKETHVFPCFALVFLVFHCCSCFSWCSHVSLFFLGFPLVHWSGWLA